MKRPMLAASASMEEMENIIKDSPIGVWMVQPKFDGIRAIFDSSRALNECLLSRKGLPIPNESLCRKMGEEIHKMGEYTEIDGLEGEIILDGGRDGTFQELSSIVNSKDTPVGSDISRVSLVIYDNINRGETPYKLWFDNWLDSRVDMCHRGVISGWCEEPVKSIATFSDHIVTLEEPLPTRLGYIVERAVQLNFPGNGPLEGFIFRRIDSSYKHGRSTLKEGGLIKVKGEETIDCEILEISHKKTNKNEAEKDELGYTKRSTKSIRVREIAEGGKEFKVNALDLGHEVSKLLASDPQKYVSDFFLEVKYNSRTSGGIPRFPKIQKLRNKNDA